MNKINIYYLEFRKKKFIFKQEKENNLQRKIKEIEFEFAQEKKREKI